MKPIHPHHNQFLDPQQVDLRNWQPPTDVYRTPEGWLIKMEVAGIDPHDLEVHLNNHTLEVRGKRRDTLIKSDWIQFSMEIYYHDFQRKIQIPENIPLTSCQLNYENGMLSILILQP